MCEAVGGLSWFSVSGMLLIVSGLLLLIFIAATHALDREWQVFLGAEEASRIGQIWRNITLEQAGKYDLTSRGREHENLVQLRAELSYRNDLEGEVLSPIRKRRGWSIVSGLTMILIGSSLHFSGAILC